MSNSVSIGDFTFKASSFSVVPGQAGTVSIQANFEGNSAGFGFTLGTMTLIRSGPSCGAWTWCGTNFPEGESSLTGHARGTVTDLGNHRWRTQGLLTLSDATERLVDGELDLTERSWKGQLLARE